MSRELMLDLIRIFGVRVITGVFTIFRFQSCPCSIQISSRHYRKVLPKFRRFSASARPFFAGQFYPARRLIAQAIGLLFPVAEGYSEVVDRKPAPGKDNQPAASEEIFCKSNGSGISGNPCRLLPQAQEGGVNVKNSYPPLCRRPDRPDRIGRFGPIHILTF